MEHHIKALSNSCFYHIRSFKHIRLSDYVAWALVRSGLEYVNSILYGTSLKNVGLTRQSAHKCLTFFDSASTA